MTEKRRSLTKKQIDILNAAVCAFQELGYENSSMDHIAKIANASKRTVYNYFPSKQILFQEVLNKFFEEIAVFKQITYSAKRLLEDQLLDFIENKVSIVNNPSWLGLIRVIAGTVTTQPELSAEVMRRASEQDDTLITWIKDAVKDKKLIVKNPELAANIFWSMVSGTLCWPVIFQNPIKYKETEIIKKEIIKIFLSRYIK